MWFQLHRSFFLLKNFFGLATPVEKIIQQPVYNQSVFDQAFSHGGSIYESYDRLEFLGDAVIQSVTSEFLYEQFPHVSEGKLTQMRSRLVRRSALNLLGYRIGLGELMQSNFLNFETLTDENKRIFGDTLEALVGAIYLNSGYVGAKHFVVDVLSKRFVKIEELEKTSTNHKGLLQELAQKLHFSVKYEPLEIDKSKSTVLLLINKKPFLSTSSRTKKRAEQQAAKMALRNKKELYKIIRYDEEE